MPPPITTRSNDSLRRVSRGVSTSTEPLYHADSLRL
jgi:hypothetical protein